MDALARLRELVDDYCDAPCGSDAELRAADAIVDSAEHWLAELAAAREWRRTGRGGEDMDAYDAARRATDEAMGGCDAE